MEKQEKLIPEILAVTAELQQLEKYYDEYGMCMSFAVLTNNCIAVSSKHWLRNSYIEIKKDELPWPDTGERLTYGLWDIIIQVAKNMSRVLERDEGETKFVYISKLNRVQTASAFDELVREVTKRGLLVDIVNGYDLLGWNVTDKNCVKIPWVTH